jgi:N-acetylneuraminic acid mutarotase
VEDGWIQISQGFPTDFIDGTAVTTGNGTVFAGFGINNIDGPATDILNQWWQFNPATESWSNAASFSNELADKRTNASIFAIGDTIYVIFGHQNNLDTRMVIGFWKYSISSNTWGNEVPTQISPECI